jgi:hypothetical protein
MSQGTRHGIAEWCKAIAASMSLGSFVGLVCGGVTVTCVYFSPFFPRDALVVSTCAIGGMAGICTAVYSLRLFSVGEVDAGDIWESVGRVFIAFGEESP